MTAFTPKKLVFRTSDAKKQKGLYCCAHGCSSKPETRKKGLCPKHYAIHRRIADPVYDRFVNFRGNAKRRGVPFNIELEEFRAFCEDTGYIVKKGMRGTRCSVDRIDNKKGYTIDNIQLMTLAKNIEKYYSKDRKTEDDAPF